MDAEKWTNEARARLEARILSIYSEASRELQEKADHYFNGYDEYTEDGVIHHKGYYERAEEQFKAMQRGEYTKKQYDEWMVAQLGRGQHWIDLKEQMAQRMAEAYTISAGYINNVLPSVYVTNNNEVATLAQASAMEQGITGIRFDLVDEYTVRRLMEQSSEVKPYKKIAINLPRLNGWNMNKLQNALLQGILQGDSVGDLAKRFMKVAEMNMKQAVRSARTAVTGAQSAGKQDRYEDLAKQGCVSTKVWVATHDERVRLEHIEADGQEVPYNEPFEVGEEELMYPADPAGSGWNIYNCRCTMRTGKFKFKSMLTDEQRKKANIRVVEGNTPTSNNINAEPKNVYIPVNTIQEAEEYARNNFVKTKSWSGDGNVSYKGLSIESANEINNALFNLYNVYNIGKLRNIQPMNFRANEWKDSYNAPMAYKALNEGELYFNARLMKNLKAISDYMQEGKEAFNACVLNIDKFSGQQREMIERYKISGRSLIAEDSGNYFKALTEHEMGHHIENTIFRYKKDKWDVVKNGYDNYAVNVSGYASSNYGEYVAESFSAYRNGYSNLIDPAMKKMFEEVRK